MSQNQTDDLLFFDAFTRIGPRPQKHPAQPWSLDHLLHEMEHCSISGALVASTQSLYYDAHFSNLALSRQIAGHRHLFAIWNVLPAVTGEFPAPGELARLMADHDVRAVTIHPKSNGWPWRARGSRQLLEWLEESRTLTILPRAELETGELEEFLERYPHLPLLLTGAVWSQQREILPLVQQHRNLHLSFEKFQIHYGLEFLHEEGCADQMIFASDAPAMSMGAHRCYVDYADVPVEVRKKIAGGNLIRLLKGQQPKDIFTNPEEDELMSAARRGQPLETTLIDMHMHILDEGLNGAGSHYRMDRGGPGGVFRLLKRLGCHGGGFMSWNGPVSSDSQAGNECTRKALDAAPKGYWGLATFDPTHYTRAQLDEMIPKVYHDRRFIGMKPYTRYGVPYHDPSYDIWWDFGNRHHLYALIHRTRSDFEEVITLAERYPRVRWVVAHCGASYPVADMTIEAVREFPNIFAEITLTPVPLGIIDYLVEGCGEDRVIYGSDLPMRDPRQQLGWVVFSRLSLRAKRKVLGENALKVIAPNWEHLPEHSRPELRAVVTTEQ